MITIIALIFAGFLTSFIINKPIKNNYKYKNAMLKSHVEMLNNTKYIKTLQDIEDLKTPKNIIEYPIHFINSNWVSKNKQRVDG